MTEEQQFEELMARMERAINRSRKARERFDATIRNVQPDHQARLLPDQPVPVSETR
jgi:hypothetical protein